MNRSRHDGMPVFFRTLAAAALLGMAAGGPTQADDRDLLRESSGDPYVFIVLDTSDSMNWTPKCPVMVPSKTNPNQLVQVPANPADCAVLCPTGDCFVQRNADAPASKFYQAKQALYEVLDSVSGIQFGFATYNQDQLRAAGKNWIYEAAGDGPNITGYGAFPKTGDQEVFGKTWTCDEGSGDDERGCLGSNPADLEDAWELGRVRRLAKAGTNFNQTVLFFIRVGGTTTWRIRYVVPSTGLTPGQSVTVRVERERCTNPNCTTRDSLDFKDVVFNPLSEFFAYTNGARRTAEQYGYFKDSAGPLAYNVANACLGYEGNGDDGFDPFNSYNLRWTDITGDARGPLFDIGDLIPMDWDNDHRHDIMKRLAPNTNVATLPAPQPDFSTSKYFKDKPDGSETFLRLKDETQRPIVAAGWTPLGASLRSFRNWYTGCPLSGACANPNGGWKAIASAEDGDWGCRRKYLLVLTDGDETCSGDPCSAATALKSDGVLTYVVAFGVEPTNPTSTNPPSTNKLTCMAAQGGTGKPIYPQNKDALVDALTDIFAQIKEEASAFASAAVPSVQAEVADRIYLSSFTPLNGESVWVGQLDAFLKPLPLDAAGRPNEDLECSSLPENRRSSCHLWDAGFELKQQAPSQTALDSAATIDASVLKIGPAVDERRVFYGQEANGDDLPRTLRLFVPPGGSPASDPDWLDLFAGLKISGTPPAKKSRAEDIIARTLVIKESTLNGDDVSYVLGDIFHSDPILVDRPNEFFFYAARLRGENGCDYKCFADKLRLRRKMLVVGSNDGQLHFFDAGIWDDPIFTTGTGRELFSFIPRLVLPSIRELAESGRHVFGIDSTPRIDDVFLDPIHNGTPEPEDREWRTLLIGGFREGGSPMDETRMPDFISGYYALDITQPDIGDEYGTVPECLSLTNQPVANCGDLPFPALLWEFTDSTDGSRWDEDLNGYADLGETWSVPTVGRVQVTENNKLTERFVAIFGGGMDAENKESPKKGNWLYMVDIETGEPIYKRRLVGSVAADPAAIDLDVDGYLDILYIATTAGFVYKVDISNPAVLSTVTLPKTSAIPNLGADVTTTRIVDTDISAVSNATWDPVPIFDTIGRPIFYAPVAFYVASQNRFALAFGTGDRENLWEFGEEEGRFFLIIDDNFGPDDLADGTIPLDETKYQAIDPNGDAPPAGTDYVLAPPADKRAGWFMDLDADERVITQAFGLAGVVIFSSYRPAIDISQTSGGDVCARGGSSRIFVVYANNASALMTVDGEKSRYRNVPEFVTNPYVEQGATKNPAAQGEDEHHSEQLSKEQVEIMETLKKFFPPCAKFGNYWISVSGIRSDTGYERYATIPVGICQRNWKEH